MQDAQQQVKTFMVNEMNTSKHHNTSKFIEQAAAASGVPMTSSNTSTMLTPTSLNSVASPTLNFGGSPAASSTLNQNYIVPLTVSQLPLPKEAVPQIPSLAIQTQLVEQHNG